MLRILGAVLAVLIVAAAAIYWLLTPPAPLPVPERGGRFDHVTVIQPGENRLANQTLTVADARITTIAPSHSPQRGPYAGMFVLPGLVNMHAHHPPQNIPVPRDLFPLLFLMHGVTSVRDAGDIDGKTVLPLRKAIEAGEMPGPRIFACGPFVDGPETTWENTRHVTDPADAITAVREIKAAGYDCVKIYNSLAPDVLAALIDAAKQEGLPTIGHVPHAVPYPGGIGDVQHFTGAQFVPNADPRPYPAVMEGWMHFDDAQLERTVRAVLEAGTANTPTLITTLKAGSYDDYETMRRSPQAALLPRYFADVVWHPTEGLPRDMSAENLAHLKAALAAEKRLVKRLFDEGATLHIGTDTVTAFAVPGADVHEEMRLFVDAGLPLEAVWKIASSGNSGDLRPDLGRLEPGAPADFLVFREDPTLNLDNLATLEAVVADGRVYTKADLEKRFARLKDYWSNPVADLLMTEAVRMALAQFRKDDK
jgi:imidazolonepropionase-like amidohydrolase